MNIQYSFKTTSDEMNKSKKGFVVESMFRMAFNEILQLLICVLSIFPRIPIRIRCIFYQYCSPVFWWHSVCLEHEFLILVIQNLIKPQRMHSNMAQVECFWNLIEDENVWMVEEFAFTGKISLFFYTRKTPKCMFPYKLRNSDKYKPCMVKHFDRSVHFEQVWKFRRWICADR